MPQAKNKKPSQLTSERFISAGRTNRSRCRNTLFDAAYIQRRTGFLLDLVHTDARRQFDELQSSLSDIDYAKIRNDPIDHAHARQRQRTRVKNLVLVALR